MASKQRQPSRKPAGRGSPVGPPAGQGAAPAGILLGAHPPAAFLAWLDTHKKEIIEQWAEDLSGLTPRYAQRPLSELRYTARGAFNAYREALATGSLQGIERFIGYITRKRLKTGFELSEVQKAFELFRTIVVERLSQPAHQHLLAGAVQPMNVCLSHTLHGFSDYFQRMHDLLVNSHARELERQVRQRTAELAEERQRYKTLVEEINDGFFVIHEGKIVFANQAFCRMHGGSRERVVGQPFLRFVAPASRPAVRAAYRNGLAGRPSPRRVEYIRLGCPPDKAAAEIKARVVDLGQGPVTIGICRDISERLALEARLREHERLAYLGQLTASLSHELRNPLSAIKMNMQILSRKLDLDGFDRRRLDITTREVVRLEEILRQLLDTARPLSLEPVPVDLAGLARGCLELWEPRLSEKGIKVGQRHARGLPPAQADPASLEQALQNLLLNALEAAGQGGQVTVWTRLARGQGGPFLELGVRDNGPGVRPQDLPLLFTPFFTRKSLGTGLGLINVKRIAEAHGGAVVVKSRPGRGASFALRLPCPA